MDNHKRCPMSSIMSLSFTIRSLAKFPTTTTAVTNTIFSSNSLVQQPLSHRLIYSQTSQSPQFMAVRTNTKMPSTKEMAG
ncbi:hypothetical protein FOTG_18526 [Fusarium oxysporum f. sp. vasinfectum 25433]|uniref:Uncharacterized protein n=1 Tax=Fusarium oxysporum f. sp. vasinfectum 25433 TaxID=1089449 RepID=X0LX09_FUSOX|nr:hypothetical protein FOTG_18526 [Fusarium oxysporum f. sp. vasinfectum 25433]